MKKYPFSLSAKIFISGASSGLGFYLAKEFVSFGYAVWGIGRRKLELGNMEPSFKKNFKYYQCDTTVKDQVRNITEEMVKSDFIPDIAVFCSGSATEDIGENDFELDKFKENFNVNLYGVLNWVEILLPFFLKRKGGAFVGISSMSTYRENHKNRIGYSAAKLSLNKTFENLRLEYSRLGIKFMIFNMGRIKEKSDLIGTSYARAADSIVKILRWDRGLNVVNIPYTQYLLTSLTRFIPEKLFRRYLMK
jgi:short-subunit dehydrogenase